MAKKSFTAVSTDDRALNSVQDRIRAVTTSQETRISDLEDSALELSSEPSPIAIQPGTIVTPSLAGTGSEAARWDHSHALNAAGPSQGIGGSNGFGSGTAVALSNHDHKLRETGGPTDMTIAIVADLDVMQRSGTTLRGQTHRGASSGGSTAANSTTTLTDLVSISLTKAGTYVFRCDGHYTSALATTAPRFAFNYTGTFTSGRLRVTVQTAASTWECFRTTSLNNSTLGSAGGITGADGHFTLFGRIVVSTAGSFVIRFCSEVAGSAITVAEDAILTVIEHD